VVGQPPPAVNESGRPPGAGVLPALVLSPPAYAGAGSLCLGGEDLCETKPIGEVSSLTSERRACETNPISPVGQDCGERNAQNEPNSRRGRVGRRANVQNKPNLGQPGRRPGVNCAKRSQFLDCGLRIGNRPAAGRRSCGLLPSACGGQNVQNEPNSRRTRYPTIPVPCGLCETKPIPAGSSGTRPQGCGTQANHAKRTQFRAARLASGGESCKTKPISESGPARAAGTNKANLPPARYPTIRLFHHSSIPVPYLSCKTKPIPAGRVGRGQRGEGRRSRVPRPWSRPFSRYCRGGAGRIGWSWEGGR
jgi:hypothetical protein